MCGDLGKNIFKKQSRIDFTICLYTIQWMQNAINFYIHVNTFFYIEIKKNSSAIHTWEIIFHDRLTTGTNDETWMHRSWHTPLFFISTLVIFMYQYINCWILNK